MFERFLGSIAETAEDIPLSILEVGRCRRLSPSPDSFALLQRGNLPWFLFWASIISAKIEPRLRYRPLRKSVRNQITTVDCTNKTVLDDHPLNIIISLRTHCTYICSDWKLRGGFCAVVCYKSPPTPGLAHGVSRRLGAEPGDHPN